VIQGGQPKIGNQFPEFRRQFRLICGGDSFVEFGEIKSAFPEGRAKIGHSLLTLPVTDPDVGRARVCGQELWQAAGSGPDLLAVIARHQDGKGDVEHDADSTCHDERNEADPEQNRIHTGVSGKPATDAGQNLV